MTERLGLMGRHLSALLVAALMAGCAAMQPEEERYTGALDPPPEVIVMPLSESDEALYSQARTALANGNLEQAEGLLDRMNSVHRHHPDVLADRAMLERMRDNVEHAERLYREVLVIEPGHPVAANDLALIARESGRVEESRALLQRALEQNPEEPRLHYNLAVLYELYLLELPNALEHYRTYNRLTDENDGRVSGWIQDLERRVEG